ncbi:MAG: hypothetical protein RLZZ612_348 [Pseudomonadota bacterium]|jgi:hypothetical protein
MFTPSQADVRRFFCEVYRKQRSGEPMQAIEVLSAEWIKEHPEFHAELADLEGALSRVGQANAEASNPFLHLSMHLSISEQCSIDQPPGVRQAVELLTARLDSLHDAHHVAMECLGRMIWESQRAGRPPDGQAYLEMLRRHATRD